MRSIVIVFEAMSALCAFTKQKKSVHPFASPSVWLSESSSAAPVKAYTTSGSAAAPSASSATRR